MKTIANLTPEQGIEIANLCYGSKIKSAFTYRFNGYDPEMYEDAREFVHVGFVAPIFADKILGCYIEISPNLDCFLYYCKAESDNSPTIAYLLGTMNQKKIQDKFREWGIQPSDKNQRVTLRKNDPERKLQYPQR